MIAVMAIVVAILTFAVAVALGGWGIATFGLLGWVVVCAAFGVLAGFCGGKLVGSR